MRDLTDREIDVLECLASGFSIKRTAEELHISTGTVSQYRSALYDKLGASSAANAISIAYRKGILSLSGASQ